MLMLLFILLFYEIQYDDNVNVYLTMKSNSNT